MYYIIPQGERLTDHLKNPILYSQDARAKADKLKKQTGTQYTVVELKQVHTTQTIGDLVTDGSIS
jgi:uncharacterized protein (UPF0218 family)